MFSIVDRMTVRYFSDRVVIGSIYQYMEWLTLALSEAGVEGIEHTQVGNLIELW